MRRGKRQFSRSQRKGRQGLWVRQPSFSWTEQDTGIGVYSDLVVTPADWEREFQVGTQPKRGPGGPVLQRLFVSIATNHLYSFTSDGVLVTPAAEVLVWAQDALFSNIVVDNTTFDNAVVGQRVLFYSLMKQNGHDLINTANRVNVNHFLNVDVKAKARLSGQSIGVAIRMNADTASTGTVDFTSLGITSAYLTTP